MAVMTVKAHQANTMGKDLMRSRTFHGKCDAVSPIMAFIERASRAARYCGLLPCKTCGKCRTFR
jgi:hypothetical protein